MAKIIYTHTDEAPMLATYSFLPVIEAYASTAGVEVETRDISLAGRVIAQFTDRLRPRHRKIPFGASHSPTVIGSSATDSRASMPSSIAKKSSIDGIS